MIRFSIRIGILVLFFVFLLFNAKAQTAITSAKEIAHVQTTITPATAMDSYLNNRQSQRGMKKKMPLYFSIFSFKNKNKFK